MYTILVHKDWMAHKSCMKHFGQLKADAPHRLQCLKRWCLACVYNIFIFLAFFIQDKNDHIFLALDMVWSSFLVAIACGLTKLCACQSKYILCNTFPIASGFMSISSKYLQPIKLVLVLKRSGNAC